MTSPARVLRWMAVALSVGFTLPAAAQIPAVRLSAAFGYTLAVRDDGSVVAWGQMMEGGVRRGITGGTAEVIEGVSGSKGVVASTSHTAERNQSLAIGPDSSLWGWGRNGEPGSLGRVVPDRNGDPVIREPVSLAALGKTVQAQACGAVATFALREDGSLWMTPGYPNAIDGVLATRAVEGATGVAWLGPQSLPSAPMSQWSSCDVPILFRDGSLRILGIWREGSRREMRLRTELSSPLANLPPLAQVACRQYSNPSYRRCVALTRDAAVLAWGDNRHRQLGNGGTAGSLLPAAIDGLPKIRSIALSDEAAFALADDGSVFAWGDARFLGRGAQLTPDMAGRAGRIEGLDNVVALTAGWRHACAAKRDGSVWCWGSNTYGELGDGRTEASLTPVQVKAVRLH